MRNKIIKISPKFNKFVSEEPHMNFNVKIFYL